MNNPNQPKQSKSIANKSYANKSQANEPLADQHTSNQPLEKKDDAYDGITFEVFEEEQQGDTRVTRSGIYLLPNLITTLSLFSGFVSILASTQGRFEVAIACVFISAVFDGLDGRVARLLNAQSAFGEQFDSITDMLAFGVAPAMLVYSWALAPLNRVGVAAAFVFTACAAFRLARFNVQIGTVEKKYFIGLASPLAALLLTSVVMVGVDRAEWLNIAEFNMQVMVAVVTAVTGLLMISNIKYYSFKEFDSERVPFLVLPVLVFLIGIVIYDIPLGILILCVAYALSGLYSNWQAKRG